MGTKISALTETSSTLNLVKNGDLILTDVTSLLAAGLDINEAQAIGKSIARDRIDLNVIISLLGKGDGESRWSLADLLSSAQSIKSGETTLDTVSSLIDAGLSAEDIAGPTGA